MDLTHGSLFSGIGGFDLGFERVGIKTIWQVECEPYCLKVLEKHWPNVTRYPDITTVDWGTVPRPDILSGGFPCQDISNAGKRTGITGSQSGLWLEFRRAIVSLRPRYVVVENVAALYGRGLDTVLGDLAQSGYDAEWDCLPAAAVGAPHLRERIFIVAYPQRDEYQRTQRRILTAAHRVEEITQTKHRPARKSRRTGAVRIPDDRYVSWCNDAHDDDVADTNKPSTQTQDNQRPEPKQNDRRTLRPESDSGRKTLAYASRLHAQGQRNRQRQGQLRRGSWWTTEPNVGRVAHGVPHRVHRLKSLGNAIVPQIAEEIGRMILAVEAQPDHQEGRR